MTFTVNDLRFRPLGVCFTNFSLSLQFTAYFICSTVLPAPLPLPPLFILSIIASGLCVVQLPATMLSFIQQRLGKTPIQTQTKITRQESIESAFSRVATRKNFKDLTTDPSSTPSLTTATSLTDTSSELTDGSTKVDDYKRSSARSGTDVGSYNENVLSAKQSRLARKQGVEKETRTVSGGALVDGDETTSGGRLLQQGVRLLDEDWSIGAMPGDNLRLSTEDVEGVKKRRSTRLDILDHASSMIEKTTGVLGKRARETVKAGMERNQAVKGDNTTPSMRLRGLETPSFEGPSRKRARFSEAESSNKRSAETGEARHGVTKKPIKPWVAQGLYVGQQRSDDARLTGTRNKGRKTFNKDTEAGERAIMPMPMWIGDKIVELGRDFKLPFDIFSPLPPGQPKPDEWKKTQKSTPPSDLLLDFANIKTQMCSLVTLPMCGRRLRIWSILHASAPQRLAATTIALTASCSMNVTTVTAK